MENLQVKTKAKKRLGRGYGSGRGGHTSSRGTKGQKARGSVHILFEGLKVRKSLLSRLPFKRGKAKFHAKAKPLTISLSDLNAFTDKDTVTIDSLIEKNIVTSDAKRLGVKIVSNGALEKKLTVSVPATRSAQEVITKLGGTVS